MGGEGAQEGFLSNVSTRQLKNAFVNLTKPEMMVIVMCSRLLIL